MRGTLFNSGVCFGLVVFASGCATTRQAEPLSSGPTFGAAYSQTFAAQIKNPAPVYDGPLVTSGALAADAAGRYESDRVKRPDAIRTSNLAAGASGGSSDSGGSSSGPGSSGPSTGTAMSTSAGGSSAIGQTQRQTGVFSPDAKLAKSNIAPITTSQPVIDVNSGKVLVPAAGGVTDPATGTFYQRVPGGFINTRTGRFSPTTP